MLICFESDKLLLLQSVVRVHPVAPTLFKRKIVSARTPRGNRILSHKRHAIHQVGQDQAVPMDRGGYRKLINNLYTEALGFFRAVTLFSIGLSKSHDLSGSTLHIERCLMRK